MASDIKTINPATGDTLNSYSHMTQDTVEQRINACHEAFLGWRQRTLEERAEVIKAIGRELKARRGDFATLMSKEMGKLRSHALQEIDLCVGICEYTAKEGPEVLKGEERPLQDGKRGLITYQPIGIIYGIQPWNFPAYQVVRYSIANLMAGNGILLKHAASVTGSALLLEKIYRQAGLPENLFAVLVIDHEQSDEVINHDLVRGVTLTGSPKVGAEVASKAGKALKKTVMELGSNDAYLVLEDADIELAVKECIRGRFYNNGEVCVAAKRFIVVDSVYDAFREGFIKATSELKVGDPLDDATDIGPMARGDLRETLHSQVEESIEKGALCLVGGEIPEGDGFYYPATILDKVLPGQPAYDDELFGPVAALIRARDAEDAMHIANNSRFGLGGGIFSRDVEGAIALARDHFDTGMVFINGVGLANPNMPFGGVKDSGYGREHGGFGMKEFVNTKAILVLN